MTQSRWTFYQLGDMDRDLSCSVGGGPGRIMEQWPGFDEDERVVGEDDRDRF